MDEEEGERRENSMEEGREGGVAEAYERKSCGWCCGSGSVWARDKGELERDLEDWVGTLSGRRFVRIDTTTLLVLRWLCFLFMLTTTIWSIGNSIDEEKVSYWHIYLTHWTLALELLFSLSALLATRLAVKEHALDPDHELGAISTGAVQTPPLVVRAAFWLHGLCLPMSVMVAILFWGLLYAPNPFPIEPLHVVEHGINAVVMVLDTTIGALPLRLSHFLPTLAYGLAYTLFSLLYYWAGGTTKSGKPYIYKPLDWREPKKVIFLLLVLALTVLPLLHLLLWLLGSGVRRCVGERRRGPGLLGRQGGIGNERERGGESEKEGSEAGEEA